MVGFPDWKLIMLLISMAINIVIISWKIPQRNRVSVGSCIPDSRKSAPRLSLSPIDAMKSNSSGQNQRPEPAQSPTPGGPADVTLSVDTVSAKIPEPPHQTRIIEVKLPELARERTFGPSAKPVAPSTEVKPHPCPTPEPATRPTPIDVSVPPAGIPAQSSYTQLLNHRGAECERWMGLGLVSEYAASSADWCTSKQPAPNAGALRCSTVSYPWGAVGTVCEGFNVTIDFEQIKTTPIEKRTHLAYKGGAFHIQCEHTALWNPARFMARQKEMLSNMGKDPRRRATEVLEGVTYLLPRHDDVNNMFHSTGDWFNMELVYRLLHLTPSAVHVVLWDRMQQMWHGDVLQPSFTTHPIRQAKDFGGKAVLVRHAIFHLEVAGNIIHPAKNVPFAQGRHNSCYASTLCRAYTSRVLRAYGLFDVAPPPIPHITLSLRIPGERNVGRVLVNQKEVEDVIRSGNMLTWEAADMGAMTFALQIALARKTNVLVGLHGAGLMWVIFLADEAVLVEVHPSYRMDRHFRHAAKLAGKHYLPMRKQDSITCSGSSDRITVDVEEFRKVLDGAVRLARGYDDGISECGLACPLEVLALDPAHEEHYKTTNTKKVEKPKLQFPCHK